MSEEKEQRIRENGYEGGDLPHQDPLALEIDLVDNELLGEFVRHDVA